MKVSPELTPFLNSDWPAIEPQYQELIAHPVNETNAAGWLADWTKLSEQLHEAYSRLYVANTLDTTDEAAESRYQTFLEEIFPRSQVMQQRLKQRLLDSGLEPAGMAVPLRKMQTEASLFREANLPLMTQDQKLGMAYNKIIGAQTVEWDGREMTLTQLQAVFEEDDRDRREAAWRLAAERQLADRKEINHIWQQLIPLRREMAGNAGFSNYRRYRWQQLHRYDYTPEDSARFRQAIEEVVAPAARRVYERRRQQLGVASLRPWDLDVDPLGRPPLRPFNDVIALEEVGERIFHRVDPQLGQYFAVMRQEALLDLENRKGKAPGAYCTSFPASQRPFIFMNAVGLEKDVRTLLHESGHAFHNFERNALPFIQQRSVGMEFAEVASFAMELLAAPYLTRDEGGFYDDPADAARHRLNHLEKIILFWPYMAVVDGFQHWAYTHSEAAKEPANCDAAWADLWNRFMTGVDWSGLEQEMMTGWHRKLHIFRSPFYYVEYGMAQVGALQVWRNARQDQAGAVRQYRDALALGGSVSLPHLYETAGARFAFDKEVMASMAALLEEAMATLDEENR